MNILAIIPARGGSKGVPGKNLKLLAGIPLIDHSILFAKSCKEFNKIVISSDDLNICKRAEALEIEYIVRPPELAKDDSLVIDAIRFTVETLEKQNYFPDLIFLLEPTSPMRKNENISNAIEALEMDFDSATTFCETEPPPGRIWRINGSTIEPYIKGSNPFLPRQVQQNGYKLTGQFYGFKRKNLLEENSISILQGRIFPIIVERDESVDIDTELDFLITEKLLELKR